MKVNETSEFLCTNIRETAIYPMVAKSLRDINKGHAHHHTGHCCGMMADTGVGYDDLNELLKNPQPLIFTLELLKFQGPNDFEKETWTMSPAEKLAVVPKLKEIGNTLYKARQYEEASDKYAEALGILEQLLMLEKPGDAEWIELDKLKIPLLLNYSQCKLIAGDYYTVITHTTEVLQKDYVTESDHVKALFRRGKAHGAVWNVTEARLDLNKVAELDPSLSKAVSKELKQLEENVKAKEQLEKASLKGIFG
ncbi:hypothetical protein C0Q70_07100 [Pomacea canaliculata]|uniref:AIP/AIPL N-terminal FKBP-type PPIase domain-containing protein n=2 Tax=Pomacea canaliculata TaxID=400727 RepID=A0A2T7PE37_POMCA|nr:hypothetical protein C0Q70_07100 [Pomacea canaliculata]